MTQYDINVQSKADEQPG